MSGEVTKYTLKGGCHCGALKFIAKNADISSPSKCSCTSCAKVGSVEVVLTGENDFSVLLSDGSEKILDYKNCRTEGPESAGIYTFGPTKAGTEGEGHQVYHHHCKTCGIQPFIIGRLDFLGGAFVVINLNCVENWDELGLDFKDVTDIKKINYVNGITDWASKKGEPWPKQAW